MSIEEVVEKLSRDTVFYEESGGGVTFSGGEPLQQYRFLSALLKACRKRNIHTAVDTCGYGSAEGLRQVAEYTDLFLFDLKMMNPKRHLEWTGVTNDSILDNLTMLSRIHDSIWIRIPVIPGINDSPEDFTAMASFLSPLSGIKQVNLLPYHKMGQVKLERLGRRYRLHRLDVPCDEDLIPLTEPFAECGLRIVIGG
jgi:pyruvate formate lyase activating enzyme